IFIDVHTGLGKFANHMLLVEQTDYETLRKLFGERVTALQPYGGSGYSIEGGIESMLFRSITRNRPIFICQEFGTYNGIRVLHALREENRWHHFHGGEKLGHYSKQNIKETFCPKSEHWRSAV